MRKILIEAKTHQGRSSLFLLHTLPPPQQNSCNSTYNKDTPKEFEIYGTFYIPHRQ
jgi:hypothetical protein